MILALDAGNSYITLGCMEEQTVICETHIKSDPLRTSDEYAVMISQVLAFQKIEASAFAGAIISSVVPQLTPVLERAVTIFTGHRPLIVGAGLKTGLNIRLDNPAQMGSDLVVGAVSAQARYPLPVVVIDMGTATTFTVIDEKRRMLGGAIMPGVQISLNALASGTSQLPNIPIEVPETCIGSNTVNSMKSGIVFGTASAIDGMLDRISNELGTPVNAVATGGAAAVIIPNCRHKITVEPGLVLHGLALLYAKNKPRLSEDFGSLPGREVKA